MSARVHVDAVDEPLVSVVVVLYGGGRLAVDAVESVVEHTSAPFEVIVVDNASPDDSLREFTAAVSGATIIEHAENVGFGPANNAAVERARGRFVCLLNPDTQVTVGWLEPLTEFAARREVGAVAPVLVDEDGAVHEAGAVVDHWGLTAPPRGRDFAATMDPPPGPCLVDYASAACLVMRTEVFRAVGGFDPRFVPAYFEDADLAFRLWEAGYQVWCHPGSRVVHLGGASSDRSHVADHWHRNRSLFLERWFAELARRPALADPTADLGRLAVWREPAFRQQIEAVPPVGTPPQQALAPRRWRALRKRS